MRTVVLVPWRPDDAHLSRLAEWTLPRLAAMWPVVEGDAPDEWSRSQAINAAAADAGQWDVAIIHDVCSHVPSPQLRKAVLVARRIDGMVIPYAKCLRLNARGSMLVMAGRRPTSEHYERRPVANRGGVNVVTRATWEATRGFDPRFTIWGGEDEAWYQACRTLSKVTRTPGNLHALWHPSMSSTRPDHILPLLARYAAAAGDRDAMRALVGEW